MDELVSDVQALLDAAGLSQAHVVGHDWGGAVAWATAARLPQRLRSLSVLATPHPAAMARAALTSTQALKSWYMLFFQLPWLPERLLNPTRPAGRRRFVRILRRSGQQPGEAARDAAALSAPGVLTGALNWYRALPFAGKPIGPVWVPTLYIWGERDAFLGRRAAQLSRCFVRGPYAFLAIPADHWLQNLPEVADLLLRHLTDNGSTEENRR